MSIGSGKEDSLRSRDRAFSRRGRSRRNSATATPTARARRHTATAVSRRLSLPRERRRPPRHTTGGASRIETSVAPCCPRRSRVQRPEALLPSRARAREREMLSPSLSLSPLPRRSLRSHYARVMYRVVRAKRRPELTSRDADWRLFSVRRL